MKKITAIALVLTVLFTVQACKSQTSKIPEGITKGQIDSVSIAIGSYFADMIKGSNLEEIDYSVVYKAMKKVRDGKEPEFPPQMVGEIINGYLQKKNNIESEKNLKEGEEFLAKNKTKEGVIELPSGLQYKIIEEGTGIQPEIDDTVTFHYTGTFIDGTQFDSSFERGEPLSMPLTPGYLIPGWIEGLQLLKVGTKAMLYIPSDIGYGAGYAQIPANSTLIFELELLEVKKPENN
jgi:FKBP-type peptidyl-prolyl cis-trans isomerase